MTYHQDEDDDYPKLPDEVLKARVERMLPKFSLSVKEAAKREGVLITSYDSITNTATPLEEVDCTITGMLVNYARLHGVHVWITPVTGDALYQAAKRLLSTQKA